MDILYSDKINAEAAVEDAKVLGYHSAKLKKVGKEFTVDKGEYGKKLDGMEKLSKEQEEELKQLTNEVATIKKQNYSQPNPMWTGIKHLVSDLNSFNKNTKTDSGLMKIAKTPRNRSEIPIVSHAYGTKSKIAPKNAGMNHGSVSYAEKNNER